MNPRTEVQVRHALRQVLAVAWGEKLIDRGQDGPIFERYYRNSYGRPMRKIIAINRAAQSFEHQIELGMLPA